MFFDPRDSDERPKSPYRRARSNELGTVFLSSLYTVEKLE